MKRRYAHDHMKADERGFSFLKNIVASLALYLFLPLLCGCSTGVWIHYPMRVQQAKLYMMEGRDNLAEKELTKRLGSSQDKLLQSLELGMVHYLAGDMERCIKEWLVAERMMEEFERRPVVSIREVGEQVGTLAVNDYFITYQGMTYERVLLHLYLALAYLMKADPEGARIELKKAEQVQKKGFDKWQEKRAAQLKDSPEARQVENELLKTYNSRYGMAGNYASFSLNPFAYLLSGWLYEEEGYPDEAFIDYRRIREMGIRSESISLTMEMLEDLMQGFRKSAKGKKEGNLLIIHHQGLIPTLEEIKIPVQIKGSLVMMAIPVYANVAPEMMGLRARSEGIEIETQELVNVYSLAKESLRERIPGIVTREIARMVVKASASREVSKKGGSLASVVTTLYNIVSERADLRSWLTVPLSIQIGRMALPPGRQVIHLELVGGTGAAQVEVDVEPGGYYILDVRSIGSRIIPRIS